MKHRIARAFDFMIVKKVERFSLPATSVEKIGVNFQKQMQMGFFVLAIPTHSTMKEITAENHAGARVNHNLICEQGGEAKIRKGEARVRMCHARRKIR